MSSPVWLEKFDVHRPKENIVSDFFQSRIVYYPGSRTDGSAVKFFRHEARCYVYADYFTEREEILAELDRHPFMGYSVRSRLDLTETDLAPPGCTMHIDDTISKAFTDRVRRHWPYARPFAFFAILERDDGFDETHGPGRLAILFIAADGYAAYDALFCQSGRAAPYAILVETCGFGGDWQPPGFGNLGFGRGGLLEDIARRTGRMPPYLLCGHQPGGVPNWTGYERVDGRAPQKGGVHSHLRTLYARESVDSGP